MPRIKGPNGLAIPVSDEVAAALLKRDEYELVADESAPAKAPAKKSAASKPSSD